jgi:hypothetical protein
LSDIFISLQKPDRQEGRPQSLSQTPFLTVGLLPLLLMNSQIEWLDSKHVRAGLTARLGLYNVFGFSQPPADAQRFRHTLERRARNSVAKIAPVINPFQTRGEFHGEEA